MKKRVSLLRHRVFLLAGRRALLKCLADSDSKRRPVWATSVLLFPALFALLTSAGAQAQNSKLVQISSRLQCQTGDTAVVSEFVIQGGAAKKVLVRAIGPSLASLGVVGALQNPTMELSDSAGALIRSNDDWQESQQAEIQASGLAPSDNRESAIVATLAPGMYATVIRGAGNSTGVAASEVYDLDSANSSITAIGTRGLVQTGNNVLISGVILSGSQTQQVLVRALGPSLATSGLSGALANPTLEFRDGNGSLLAANDNWRASQETVIQNSGLAPPNDFESAIVSTIPPGNYTAIVAGATGGTGLGFVQYYALPYSGSILNPVPPKVIASPLNVSGTVGQPFVYQFVANGATSLAVSSPPPGLAYNSFLHAIVGNPSASGTFQTGLSATNPGGTVTATLTTTVQPPPSSGPRIISSTAATGRTGRAFTFQVVSAGGGSAARASATGLPGGLTIDPVTGVISGTPTADGSFAVTLTVISGAQTANSIVQLTFSSDPALPVIVSPSSATLTQSQAFTYTINAPSTASSSDPPAYTLIGNLPNGLGFNASTGTISGTFTDSAPTRQPLSPEAVDLSGGIITNVQLFATNSHGTATVPLIFYLAPTGAVNIATRLAVGTGNDVLIAGFIITGNAPKKVVVRAIGPSLSLGGVIQDPTLELHDSKGLLGANDNWRDSQENEIFVTTIPPTNNLESAILAVINPGNYTAIVAGKNNITGVAVVEVYDLGTASLDTSSNAQLAQISTRGKVLSGDSVMIGGFILSGPSSKVVVRAIGPSLNGIVPGALQDPTLELHDGSGATLASNDDWRSTQEQAIIDTTVPPKDNRESAIVATLPPGNYTGIVRGKNNTTGVGLVEVYGLQ